jgi:hypothetical protein
MRYIIASKGYLKLENTVKYFELGWEVSVTQMDIKYLLSIDFLNSEDIIVTLEDRKFLYEKLFKRVINWDNFREEIIKTNIFNSPNIEEGIDHDLNRKLGDIEIIDLVADYFANSSIGKTQKWCGQKISNDILFSFNYSDLLKFEVEKEYVCLTYRRRKWEERRNLNDDYFSSVLDYIKSIGLNCYIVGIGGEKWDNKKDVFYVNLQEWASLLNKGCRYTVSTMTGPLNLTYFCGKPYMKNIIFDLASNYDENVQVCMGKSTNFKDIKNLVYRKLPTINELSKILT